MGLIILGTAAFAASYLGVLLMIKRPQQKSLLDIPNARSSHTVPTPRGGGLVITAVTAGALVLLALSGATPQTVPLFAYLAGTVIIGAVSFLDDVFDISFLIRIAAQAAAAILMVGLGFYLMRITLPFVGTIELGWIGAPLTFVFIVGLTNAYNFMDGIDGMAGLQAVIAGFYFVALASPTRSELPAITSMLIGASTLGFLIHNWSPARIFMGDVGSTFLGFSFAVLIILLNEIDSRFFVMGVLALWPFIVDTSYTLVRRTLKGENIFEAHRSHLYQQLIDKGYSHSKVSLLYGVLSMAGILLGAAWYLGPSAERLVLLANSGM